jgi:hypothetical protein
MPRRRSRAAPAPAEPPTTPAASEAAPAAAPTTWARLLPGLLIAAVWLGNALATWGRWGDFVSDCGRELDVPWQLSQGRLLYADVRFWYGPLPPYVNAALFRAFGASVDTLAAAGLAAGALLAFLGYRTARLFCDRGAATLLGVALLQVNVFAQLYPNNIFNFVMPYASAATYGMVLALASVFFLLRHARAGRVPDLWIATALLGLVGLCKLEPLFAAGMAHVAFLAGLAATDRPRIKQALVPYVLPVAVMAAVYGAFHARVGAPLWRDNLFLAANVTAGDYGLRHAGLLDLGPALEGLLVSLLGLAACAACVFAAQTHARREAAARPEDAGPPPLLTPATVVAALVAGGIVAWMGPLKMFRALPLLMGAALFWTLRRVRAGHGSRADLLAAAVLWVFALAALPRILLRAGAEHYGFYLLVPGLVAFAVFWCREMPELSGSDGRDAAAAVGAAMLLAAALSHAWETRATARLTYGDGPPVRAGTRRGALPVPIPYVGTVDEAVRFLEQQPAGRRALSVPQGVGIPFVAGLDNALGLHTLLPLDIGGAYSEENLIRSLEQGPPDFVVVTRPDTRAYGKEGFGIDYGLTLAGWIGARYAPLKSWRTQYYSVQVLGPRQAAAP